MHLMTDIEALSLRCNAVVVEVGYAVFNNEMVVEKGSWPIEIQPMTEGGGHTDFDTWMWWVSIPERLDHLRNLQSSKHRVHIHQTAAYLKDIIETYKIKYVWAKHPEFDIAVLKFWYQAFGVEIPWNHRMVKDLSTLKIASGPIRTEENQNCHQAAADAEHQALEVIACHATNPALQANW